ncbi:MAG TPA: hypothetical protein VKA53_03095 [Thermoanaerobaculia bacterium]|nr:hypothetical protein [Thermoanaerobaculia bacterium]
MNGDSTGMGSLQELLLKGANDLSRPQVARRAQDVADKIWGVSIIDIDEHVIRTLDERLKRPPADGKALRAHLCALDIPLVEALKRLDYWPDLRWGSGRAISPEQLLLELCKAGGLKVKISGVQGNTITLQVG